MAQLTDKEIDEFYERFGSRHLQTQSEMMKDYSGHILDLENKTISFLYSIATTIGVFAGFGFTAISRVEYLHVFMLGELLLMSAVFFTILFIQRTHLSTKNELWNQWNDYRIHFNERNNLFSSILQKVLKEKIYPENNMRELFDKDKQLIKKMYTDGRIEDKFGKSLKRVTYIVLCLFTLGVLLILVSFLCLKFLSIL